jgi:hypothetical protein
MQADDDGVVEAYQVMQMVGATEDEIRILEAKCFIRVLNEDLVAFLQDWNEHNLIRADRIVPSIYRPLLIKLMPELKLLTPRQRADLKK